MTLATCFEAAVESPDAHRRRLLLQVDGMHCGRCVRRLVAALEPAAEADVDLTSATAELRWDARRADLGDLLTRIRGAGLEPVPLAPDADYMEACASRRAALARIGIAALLGMQAMMFAASEYFGPIEAHLQMLLRWTQWLLATPVLFYSGAPLLRQGLGALWQRRMTMDTPVALALIGAYSISTWNLLQGSGHVYFDSVVMFVLLLSLARFWQESGRLAAADRLRRLVGTQPLTARRLGPTGVERVPTSALQAGDVLSVPPGEVVPADGRLLDAAALDESLLHGESLPRQRSVDEWVLAGSYNAGPAPIRLRVEASGQATRLSQLARLVAEAHRQRGQVASIADRVAAYFVPMVLALAALAWWQWWPDADRAMQAVLAVLVVTCPCALSMAVPTSLAAAATRLGREGLLLVRPEALLALRDLRHVVFDKTGTLTTGAMQLRAVHCAAGMDEAAARRWAAMLESGITHPIARALCAGRSEAPAPAQTLLPQGGVGGDLDGVPGSLRPVVAPATGADPAAEGLRWVRLERNGQRVADFGFAEVLRPEALAVVSELQARGLTVHLLSGDAHVPVTRLAAALRIDGVHAGAQPEDKLARVRAWQAEGGRVLMVGDGINDGPTLAAADVAVSLGGGASLAQGQGDLLLLRDDLRGLLALLEVAQSTRRIALQNVLWALGYNLTLVPLAFMGWIAPAMAALGMGGSSLLVTLSALRLLRTPAPDLSVAPAVRESAA